MADLIVRRDPVSVGSVVEVVMGVILSLMTETALKPLGSLQDPHMSLEFCNFLFLLFVPPKPHRVSRVKMSKFFQPYINIKEAEESELCQSKEDQDGADDDEDVKCRGVRDLRLSLTPEADSDDCQSTGGSKTCPGWYFLTLRGDSDQQQNKSRKALIANITFFHTFKICIRIIPHWLIFRNYNSLEFKVANSTALATRSKTLGSDETVAQQNCIQS